MHRNPKPLPFSTIPTYRQKLLYTADTSTQCVLSYDPAKMDLVRHRWPTKSDGTRVPPYELLQYREAHEYLGPGCLCPLLESLSKTPAYKEAVVYLAADGRYKGEYVAECAELKCGYLVPVERIYAKNGILVKTYPLRDTPCPPSPQVISRNGARGVETGQLKTHDPIDMTDPPLSAGGFEGMELGRRTNWKKLWHLERIHRPGLTQEQFLGLFVKCEACGLVNTHQMFRQHHCRPQTMTESGSDSELSD